MAVTGWRKSSHSTCHGACVEVSLSGGGAQMRDSKDPSGPVLEFTRDEWEAFTEGVRDGEFTLPPRT